MAERIDLPEMASAPPPPSARQLFLIDGYAQIFRAFHAIRTPMRSSVTGEPTGAVFGFAGMLLKLLTQHPDGTVVVALDAPGKTFRDDLFAEYKGTRSETPPDLTRQIPRILEMIDLFGIPRFGRSGLEADDIIASITHRILKDASLDDVSIRIVSKDKDLQQLLVDGRVVIYDVHTDVTLDAQGLMATKGIRPDQVIDFLTLTGDTVDNVPGVAGIGPKTAAQLLQDHGSVDGIYASLEKLSVRQREAFAAAHAHIALSRALVTLTTNAEFGATWDALQRGPVQRDALLRLFKELGIQRYDDDLRALSCSSSIADAGPVAPPSPSDEQEPDLPYLGVGAAYTTVTTPLELAALCVRLRDTSAGFSLATASSDKHTSPTAVRLAGIAFAWATGLAAYVRLRPADSDAGLDPATDLDPLRLLLEDPAVPKVCHGAKTDAAVLMRAGLRVDGVRFDSSLAAQLATPDVRSSLTDLCRDVLRYRLADLADSSGAEGGLDSAAACAAERADAILRLRDALMPTVDQAGMASLIADIEAPLGPILAEMEHAGIRCVPEELARQGELLAARVSAIRDEIFASAGFSFSLDSPKQVGDALYDRLGFAVARKTKTGGRSTDAETLEALAVAEDAANPVSLVPRRLLEYRTLTKLISTYLGNLRDAVSAETGRIHTTYSSLGAATGRLASNGPNLQNIPIRGEDGRQIRKAFVAESGHALISMDYSQIELRVLAHCSGDAALVAAFEREDDIHRAVAAEVFGVAPADVTREQRSHAKTINFGIVYGITPFGLARRIPGLDRTAATALIASYAERFSGVRSFLDDCVRKAETDGYVCTLLGRRRYIPEVLSKTAHTRALGERLALNTVVQGSAADLIKLAMVRIGRHIHAERLPVRMLLQIHDELLFETPAEGATEIAELLKVDMESAMSLRVPLVAEYGIGADWYSAK
jgi:DNA polymerase-1